MAQAYFIMPFPDFDYTGWAEQIGLSVQKSALRADGCLDFLVEGHSDAIEQFEAELDFPAEEVGETVPLRRWGKCYDRLGLLAAVVNGFGLR